MPAETIRRALLDWLRSRRGTRWKVWDFAVGWTAFYLGFVLSPWTHEMPRLYYMVIVGATYGTILLLASRVCGVPTPEQRASAYDLVSTAFLAVFSAYLVFALVVAFVLVRVYGRYIIVIMSLVAYVGLIVPRWLLLRLMAIHPLNLVIYGAGETGRRFGEKIRDSRQFSLVGFLDGDAALRGTRCGDTPVLGSIQEVGATGLDALGVNVVVVCVGPSLQETNAAALLRLPLHGIEVLNQGAFVEYYFKEISVEYANPHWFVSAPSLPGTPSTFAAKRVLSLALGTGGLLLSLPLWPLIALGIRLDSHGPVFFRQRRVGWRGRPFDIVKFRTMQVDAEKDGAQWTRENDPRITRFGRFLRVTRLDELPQLWNVVRGEMALVGPRPERPEFVAALAQAIPFYEQRHLVPPGVTGWAQIRYGYGASEEDARRKLEYDLYYIRHMSLGFDVEILFRTIPLIMKGSR